MVTIQRTRHRKHKSSPAECPCRVWSMYYVPQRPKTGRPQHAIAHYRVRTQNLKRNPMILRLPVLNGCFCEPDHLVKQLPHCSAVFDSLARNTMQHGQCLGKIHIPNRLL